MTLAKGTATRQYEIMLNTRDKLIRRQQAEIEQLQTAVEVIKAGEMTPAAKQNRANAIWRYVRENRHSLDSERATKQIRAAIDRAVAVTTERLSEAMFQAAKDSQVRHLKKEVRRLKRFVKKRGLDEELPAAS